MSDSAAGNSEFTELWRSVSKLCDGKIQNTTKEQQMPGTTTSPVIKGFQSPQGRYSSRHLGLVHGDSPGDVEPSQDIFWDPTSPNAAAAGLRNHRVVEISDIVNRIAPKDVKEKGTESPLLQWIGDNAVPSTPDIPKPRVKKKYSRHSSVEDLVKLARQFDENMQQDREMSEHPTTVNNNLSDCGNISKTEQKRTLCSSKIGDYKGSSSSDRVEAELHALFDCSTQKFSGQLSQVSSASSSSQEVKDQPVMAAVIGQTELKSDEKCGPARQTAEEKGSAKSNVNDFDDDWEDDDLLNDPVLIAMTQNPLQELVTTPKTESNTKTNTTCFTSMCNRTANTISAHQSLCSRPSRSELQELCPKPKTTNRSTFKLEPNPHFQAASNSAAKDISKTNFTVIQSKPQIPAQKCSTTKTQSVPQPDKITTSQKNMCAAPDTVKGFSDSLWDDDGDDDALFYQVCDTMERISNSQPLQAIPGDGQEKQDAAEDRRRKSTKPLPIETVWSTSAGSRANKQSPCAYVRSNSLPETRREGVSYQEWNIPMKGANSRSSMSHSLPGSRAGPGTFSQRKSLPGTFQAGNDKVDMNPYTVSARVPSTTPQTACKRSVSDSAVISNKVFVTSQAKVKCSAAEIERKKQEALARRRLRMQNTSKP